MEDIKQLKVNTNSSDFSLSIVTKTADEKITITNVTNVIIPNPRPVRPKNCCSKGAVLKTTEIIVCIIVNVIIMNNIFNFLIFNTSEKVKKIFGSKYKPHNKIKINLGIIIESLLIQGEITIVIKNE